ncbi:ComEA family DNA-binding protein [Paenibacillus ihuae]|uniref:ComEA family DNA-binding protein n=1 Tax=Paenibacillus ihuae TaxID=1232431 RepID=UPI0006D54E86|nr:helix-hairpin-helix domain-containing protein [Paenibacillus ihuae]
MNKRMFVSAIAAALLGGGLVWAADHRAEEGIAGWETLNAGMAQALGAEVRGAGTGAAGGTGSSGDAGAVTDGENAGASGGAEGSGKVVSGVTAGAGEDGAAGSSAVGTGGNTGTAASGAVSGSTGGSVGDGEAAGSGAGASGAVSGNAAAGTAGSSEAASSTADGGTGGTAPPAAVPPAADGRINVNTADAAALMNLPGIGEKKAQAIIDYRSSTGAYRSLADLGKVKGIGPKMLEQLEPLIVF